MFEIYVDGRLLYHPFNDELCVLNARLTVEMGKAGALEFRIPQDNLFYTQMNQLKTMLTVKLDDDELFRGRVLTNERDFNNVRKIYAEGDLAYLVDSVQKAERYCGLTHDLFHRIIAAHNERADPDKRFTVGTIGIENREIIITGKDADVNAYDYDQIAINSIADEWQTTFDYIETCLIDTCGGYLRTRKENGVIYIDLIKNYSGTATQEIEFGVNMLDLTEEVSAEELFTVLIPIGDENLTIASVNGGSDELVDTAAVSRYGRIVRTHVFSGVNQPATLLENGKRYLASHANIPTTFTVKAVDLHLINPDIPSIRLGDRVHINSLAHGLVEYLVCTKIEYDLENPANTVYTFGNPKQSLTERYRKDKQIKNDARGAGGAAKAAKAAESKASEALEDFFDAWINVDPSSAHISLGTLFKDYEKTKLVLQRDCGIDINGVTGNVNIKSLQSRFDELGKEVSNQAAAINLINDDTTAKIEMITAWHEMLDEKENSHYAEFVMYANSTESAIRMKADKVTVESIATELHAAYSEITSTKDVLTNQVGIKLDGSSGNVNISTLYTRVDETEKMIQNNSAKIDSVSTDLGSRISLVAKSVEENASSIASLQLTANSHGSQIDLKADKVTINSKITEIEGKLEATEANIDKLYVKKAEIDRLIASFLKSTEMEVTYLSATNLRADVMYMDSHMVATRRYVDDKIKGIAGDNGSGNYATKAWVQEQGYMSSLPDTVKTGTIYATTHMYFEGWTVATQKWVKEYISKCLESYSKNDHSHKYSDITNKPSSFAPSAHKHYFNGSTTITIGHTHKYTDGSVTKNTYGMNTNYNKTVSISGYTNNN